MPAPSRADIEAYALARRHEDEFRDDLVDAFGASIDAIDVDDLEEAIDNYDYNRIVDIVLPAAAITAIAALLGLALFGAIRAIAGKTAHPHAPINPLDSHVVDWIQSRALESISGLQDQARETIRGVLVRGYRAGWTSRQIALAIKNQVWLLDRHAAAVQAMRARMVERGMSEHAIGRAVEAAVKRYLLWRAGTIAATEISRAATQARILAWLEAIDAGELDHQARVMWLTVEDERRCPICKTLHRRTRLVEALFPGGIDGPPAHPSCRCWIILITDHL